MSHNVAAKVKSVEVRFFDTINWYYNGSSQQTGNVTNGGLINNITLSTTNSNRVSTLSLLKINLRNTARVNKNTTIRFKIFFVSSPEFRDSAIFPSCPRGANNFLIDKCSVTNAELEQILMYLGETTPLEPYFSEYTVASTLKIYHVMDIEGHFNYEDFTNVSTIETYNTFYTFVNTTEVGFNDNLILYIPPIELVIDEENAENEAAEKELEGTSNIENQTPQNTTGGTSENQQTTSIIGTISSFVGAFSNISPAQNCQMDLPFPEFVGGTQRVDICQGKDKAPAIITIASSLLLIVTFVPVAFIVLSMIYREIRSFTNG